MTTSLRPLPTGLNHAKPLRDDDHYSKLKRYQASQQETRQIGKKEHEMAISLRLETAMVHCIFFRSAVLSIVWPHDVNSVKYGELKSMNSVDIYESLSSILGASKCPVLRQSLSEPTGIEWAEQSARLD